MILESINQTIISIRAEVGKPLVEKKPQLKEKNKVVALAVKEKPLKKE